MDVEKVKVVVAGQLGAGFAKVCAQAGLSVWKYDVKEEALENGQELIEKLLSRSVEKDRLTASEKNAVLERLTATTTIEDAKQVDVVIEAVVENIDVKKSVFQQLDQVAGEETTICLNASDI